MAKKKPTNKQTIGLGWFAGQDLTPQERRAKLRAMGYDAPEPAGDDPPVLCAQSTETDSANMPGSGEGQTASQATPRDPEARIDDAGGVAQVTTTTITSSEGERTGDVPVPAAEAELVDGCTVVGPLAYVLPGEKRKDAWERIRKEARAAGLNRRQSMWWANRETERLFPPPPPEPEPADDPPEPDPPAAPTVVVVPEESPPVAAEPAPAPSSEEVPGLGDLPESWGTLPANASLQVEISWVSANRLRVKSGSGVDLSRALSPAPSYAALSWLETSILFPSKFADISVKATQGQEDEQAQVRREKLAIEEIRALLAEMLEG